VGTQPPTTTKSTPQALSTSVAHVGVKSISNDKWDEQVFRIVETIPMEMPSQHLIAEVPRRRSRVEMIGIDLGDVWSHYYTLKEDGEVVDRGRFRMIPTVVEKRFGDFALAETAISTSNFRCDSRCITSY
jgi:hypothetical protein